MITNTQIDEAVEIIKVWLSYNTDNDTITKAHLLTRLDNQVREYCHYNPNFGPMAYDKLYDSLVKEYVK